MAQLNNNIIGTISGRFGEVVARNRNGKTFLVARPRQYTLSRLKASVEARQKFAVVASFSKIINASSTLKSLWAKAENPATIVFNTICRQNYEGASIARPTERNIITPGGFPLSVENTFITTNGLTCNIDTLNTNAKFSGTEVDLEIWAIICFNNPYDSSNAYYSLSSLNRYEQKFDFTKDYALNIAFNSRQQDIASMYVESVIYLAAVSKDAVGNAVQCSETSAKVCTITDA
jgi:hypothetical protein